MGDKLNTAEYDAKGRCVRHPAIRLRKKKLFGGWKIIIGHCPECCLDEMRRVRDEIGAEQDGDNYVGEGDHRSERGEGGRKSKKKKKKSRDRDRHRNRGERRSHHSNRPSAADSISEVGSEGQQRPPGHYNSNIGSQQQLQNHPQSMQQQPHRDGESEATGSTAPNSSMDGNGSVVSDPYIPRYQDHHQHGGRGSFHQHQSPPHHPQQQQYQQQYHPQQHQSPQPPQRTMVLSMAFTDPQTGQRGTYTGQVNSVNHKPDGKGTVYYANGNIAEGSWMNGMLVESEEDHGRDVGRMSYPPPPLLTNRSRSESRGPSSGRSVSRSRGRVDPPNNGVGQLQAPSSLSTRSRGSSRSRGGSQDPNKQFNGNLEKLNQLGGVSRVSRGAASVGSYGSRNSHQPMMSKGSSSVQDYVGNYHSGGRSVMRRGGGGGGGGGYNSGYLRPSQSFHGQSSSGYS